MIFGTSHFYLNDHSPSGLLPEVTCFVVVSTGMKGSVTGVGDWSATVVVSPLVGGVFTIDVGSEASAGAVVGGILAVVESEVWVPSLPPGLVVVVVSVVTVVTVGAGVVTMAVSAGFGAGVNSS